MQAAGDRSGNLRARSIPEERSSSNRDQQPSSGASPGSHQPSAHAGVVQPLHHAGVVNPPKARSPVESHALSPSVRASRARVVSSVLLRASSSCESRVPGPSHPAQGDTATRAVDEVGDHTSGLVLPVAAPEVLRADRFLISVVRPGLSFYVLASYVRTNQLCCRKAILVIGFEWATLGSRQVCFAPVPAPASAHADPSAPTGPALRSAACRYRNRSHRRRCYCSRRCSCHRCGTAARRCRAAGVRGHVVSEVQ